MKTDFCHRPILLFNIAIDFLYEEICDFSQYVINNYIPLSLCGFVNDQTVPSYSENSVIRTIELIQILFLKIGLEVTPT